MERSPNGKYIDDNAKATETMQIWRMKKWNSKGAINV